MLLRILSLVLFYSSIQVSIGQNNFSGLKTEPGKIFVKLRDKSDEKITYSIPEKNQSGQRVSGDAQVNPQIPSSLRKIIQLYHIEHIAAAFNSSTKINERLKSVYVVSFSNEAEKDSIIKSFQRLSFVEYAEAIPLYEMFYTPNDIKTEQWYLPQINASGAWDLKKGTGAVIAIVDDAVRLTHEDLAANIWNNPGEIAGNGVDDDGNGYVDDVHGYDVADNDNNPTVPGSATNSEFTHGTHCSGIAAAVTDNGKGISSVSYGNKIMAVKCKSSSDLGPSLPYAYQGLIYAIETGADVISMSWGGYYYSATYQLLFDAAYDEGIVCVAAAGNSNTDIPMYPASYNHVISVAATDQNDLKAYFSNYGSTIDVSAPGVNIYSTLAGSNSSYGFLSGTSMACPLVSGLCALMISYNPALTPDEVEQCLKARADFIDNLNTPYSGQLGAGRINAYNTLLCLQKTPTALFESDKQLVCTGESVSYKDLSILNASSGISWQWTFAGGTPSTSTSQNPMVTYASSGVYSATLKVTNAFGNSVLTKTNYITVNKLTAVLSGDAVIPAGGDALLKVDFSNIQGPFTITYTDGTNTYTKNNINSNPYYFTVTASQNKTYYLTGVSSAFCNGTYSGSANISISTGGTSTCSGTSMIFEKAYGGTGADYGNNIIQFGTDYYMVGIINAATNNAELVLSKMNSTFDVQWSKTIGVPSTLENIYQSNKSSDGNILISGNITGNSGSLDGYVVKIDLNGNLLWSKSYGGSGNEYLYDIQNTSDGGYVLAGRTDSYSGSLDAYVAKVDVSGTLQWSKSFGVSSNDYAFSCLQTSDGGYVTVAASQEAGYTNYQYLITKLDASGNVVWAKSHGSYDDEGPRKLIITSDGGFLIGGTSRYRNGTPDCLVSKHDAAGNLQWIKTFGGDGADDVWALKESPDGNYLITGFTDSYGAGGRDVFLTKFDKNGNTLWANTYGGTQDEYFAGFGNITNMPDGGYAMVATTNSYGAGNLDLFMIKTDCKGKTDCSSTNVTFQNYPVSVVLGSVTITMLNAPGSSVPATTVSNVTLQKASPCQAVVCSLKADFYANDTTICKGNSISFVSTSTNATTYKWYLNNVLVGQGTSVSQKFSSAGDYKMILAVTNNSCSDTDTLIVSVKDNPTLTVSKDTLICDDSFAKLWVSGAKTYQWTYASNLSCINCANPLAYTPAGSSYYFVKGISEYGCEAKDSVYVKVRCCVSGIPSPAAAFIISDSIICKNESVSFNASYTFKNTLQVLWDFGPAALPQFSTNLYESNVRYSQPGHWPVKLTVTDNCGKDSFMTFINVFNPPTIKEYPDVIICSSNKNTQFNITPVSDYEYAWVPSKGLSDPTIANPWVNLADTSITYALHIKDSKTGCETTDNIKVSAHTSFAIHAMNDTIINRGDEVTLKACCSNVFSWYPATYLSDPTASKPVAKPDFSMWYYVNAPDSISCIATDSVFITVREFEPFIPNLITPNNDQMNDSFVIRYLCEKSKLEIYNRWGDLVYKAEDYQQDWKAASESDGIYYYVLIDGCSGKKYKGWLQVLSSR